MVFLLLAAAGFVAWLVSTLAAGGGGMLLLPVVAYLIGPKAVAPVLALGSLFSGPARIFIFWQHIEWRIVRWYVPGAVCGGAIGAWIFAQTEAQWLKIGIGLFLISTVFQFRLGEKQRSFPMKIWFFLPVGFVVSLISGIIGEAGPVLNPFYLSAGVEKERLIATKTFNAFVMQIAKITGYTVFGAIASEFVLYGLVIGIAAGLATWLGKKLLGRLDAKRFRQGVIAVMVVTGAAMLWREIPELFR